MKTFKPKPCESCHEEYVPRSGRSKWCDDCLENFVIEKETASGSQVYDPLARSRKYEQDKKDPEWLENHRRMARESARRSRLKKGCKPWLEKKTPWKE